MDSRLAKIWNVTHFNNSNTRVCPQTIMRCYGPPSVSTHTNFYKLP
jgi:hypothetical protein